MSGLAAAHRLLELSEPGTLDVEVVESSARLGGAIHTEPVDAYPVVEHGADMFVTDKPWALDLCRRLGLEGDIVRTNDRFRRTLVLRDGKAVGVPEGFTLMAPSELMPILQTPILSVAGKARMALELAVPRRKEEQDESIASFVRRRFGQELLDRIVQPLVGGIYTGDPEKLSLRATLPRFCDMESTSRSVALAAWRRSRDEKKRAKTAETTANTTANTTAESGARYGLFVSLGRGMKSLVEALRAKIEASGKVRLRTKVVGLERRGEGYRVGLSPEGHIDCDGVVVALPAYTASELLRPLSAPLANGLDRIPYASTAVVLSGHALADVAHALDAFGLVVPHVEKRRILAVSFSSRKLKGRAPRGSVLLRTFVGGAMQPELFELSDARIEGLVLEELRAIFDVGGAPDFIRVVRWTRAMPQYHIGHLALVDELEAESHKLSHLAIAGSYLRGVGIPDCVRSGEAAAERVLTSIQSR